MSETVLSPALLCFNLRREHIGESERAFAAKLSHAHSVLARARAEGWRVAHAHTIARREQGVVYGALPGLEPLVDEPVFALRQICAFAEPGLAELAKLGGGSVHLIGAVHSRAGLATVLLGDELGLSVNVIAEACFRGREAAAALRAEEFIHARCGAASVASSDGGNVICLETRRHERV